MLQIDIVATRRANRRLIREVLVARQTNDGGVVFFVVDVAVIRRAEGRSSFRIS